MPFKSKAQVRFMFARRPKTARKWAEKYGMPEDLPEKKATGHGGRSPHGKTRRGS